MASNLPSNLTTAAIGSALIWITLEAKTGRSLELIR
jgi:hypothetical protein